jgi:hypothetical protein
VGNAQRCPRLQGWGRRLSPPYSSDCCEGTSQPIFVPRDMKVVSARRMGEKAPFARCSQWVLVAFLDHEGSLRPNVRSAAIR